MKVTLLFHTWTTSHAWDSTSVKNLKSSNVLFTNQTGKVEAKQESLTDIQDSVKKRMKYLHPLLAHEVHTDWISSD